MADSATPQLDIDGLVLGYAGQAVVQDLALRLERGQLACLLGASGCGKTTVLRAIAGFEAPRAGSIRIAGREVASATQQSPPERRGVGMVFQDHALFPHLTVRDNIGFGLRRLDRETRAARIEACVETLELQGLLERYPHELSGGQQQRVALARALAPQPALLLLDEPFANLDAQLRLELAARLKADLRRLSCTALLVTHDQAEAFAFADALGVMQAGRLLQWGSPYALYHEPASVAVASFIGESRWLDAECRDPGWLETSLGRLPGAFVRGAYRLLVRPDDLRLDPAGVPAQLLSRAFRGADVQLGLRLSDGAELLMNLPSHQDEALGEQVSISAQFKHVVAFPRA